MSQALASPEPDWVLVRQDYENFEGTEKQICERYGITLTQLRLRRKGQKWMLRGNKQVSRADLIDRMFRLLDKQVHLLEKQMGNELDDKNALLLGTLSKTAEKLLEIDRAGGNSAERKDITALRAKVARRCRRGSISPSSISPSTQGRTVPCGCCRRNSASWRTALSGR